MTNYKKIQINTVSGSDVIAVVPSTLDTEAIQSIVISQISQCGSDKFVVSYPDATEIENRDFENGDCVDPSEFTGKIYGQIRTC